jgi:alkylated DNA nucleotide flippase Atl1
MEFQNEASQPASSAEQSLEAPTPEFVEQVMIMVRAIPPGRVMTYGDIATILTARAEFAGIPEAYGPRMVGHVMSRFGGTLPWWRVIRATGHPPRFHQEQALPFYREENTPLIGPDEDYRIDLKRARFLPEGPEDRPRQTSF